MTKRWTPFSLTGSRCLNVVIFFCLTACGPSIRLQAPVPVTLLARNSTLISSNESITRQTATTLTLTLLGQNGNAYAGSGNVAFSLASSSPAGSFSSVTKLNEGVYVAQFIPSAIGTAVISATVDGENVANSLIVQVTAGPPSKVVLTGPAHSGKGCRAYQASLQDAVGDAAITPIDMSLTLTGNGSGTYYSDPSCTTPIDNTTAPLQITSESSNVNYYFKDSIDESVTLAATHPQLVGGSLAVLAGCPSLNNVQSVESGFVASSQITINTTLNVQSGNLLVVGVYWWSNDGIVLQATSSSVSDTLGNTWIPLNPELNLLANALGGGNNAVQFYYAENAVGGATDMITMTTSGGAVYYVGMYFTEYSGFPASGVLDIATSDVAQGVGATVQTAGQITTAGPAI